MKNVEIASVVVEKLKEMGINADYEKVLHQLDISRTNEKEPANIELIVNNLAQMYEEQ